MNSVRSLTFLATSWSLAASVFIVAVTAGLCFFAWRRGYRRDYGAVELLRLTIVALTVVLFNQPEWIEEFLPEERPTIAVLCDASRSMDTRDVALGGSTSRITRRESIAPLAEQAFWKSLAAKHSVVIQPFAKGADERTGSNLHDPLAQAPQRFQNLRGIVLASDGDWNEGRAPVEAAAALRLKDIPVFVVPVGSSSRLPDLELLSLDAPTFGVVGKSVRIPFTIESTLPREVTLSVALQATGGDDEIQGSPHRADGPHQ
jgi:hypothetical protein